MVRLGMLVGPIVVVFWVYCVVDVISRRPDTVRNLPKVGWLVLVLLFPVVGSIAWLVAGRPRAPRPVAHQRPAPDFPEYDRPGRAAGITGESDEEFLRRCRERAEEQRRRHREQARQPEQDAGDET